MSDRKIGIQVDEGDHKVIRLSSDRMGISAAVLVRMVVCLVLNDRKMLEGIMHNALMNGEMPGKKARLMRVKAERALSRSKDEFKEWVNDHR